MSRTTIRSFIVATIALLIAGSLFGYMVYVSDSKQQQLNEELQTIRDNQAQEAAYLQAQRIAQESTEDRAALTKAFLQEEGDSIDFLQAVEGLAAESRLSLETQSLEVIEDKKAKTRTLLVGLQFDGTRVQVEAFIRALEQLPYIAVVERFMMEALPGTGWEAQATVSVTLQAYAE